MPSNPLITFEPSASGNGAVAYIKSDTGTQIFYTVDGEDPTDKSTVYNAPFPIVPAMTVKAIAKDGVGLSQVVAGIYPERSWSIKNLAYALIGFFALLAIVMLVFWLISLSNGKPMFGTGSETAMGLSTIFCITGCLLLALLAFFLGDSSLILSCLLAEVVGCATGWLLGTYFSPEGSGEAQAFQQIGLTVGTLLSGVLLSKFLRVLDSYLEPEKKNYGRIVLLATYYLTAALFISVTVYVDRAYGFHLMIDGMAPDSTLRKETDLIRVDRVINTAGGEICVILAKAPNFSYRPELTGPESEGIVDFFASPRSAGNQIHWSLAPASSALFLRDSGDLQLYPEPSTKTNDKDTARQEEYSGWIVAINQNSQGEIGKARLWIGDDAHLKVDKGSGDDPKKCTATVERNFKPDESMKPHAPAPTDNSKASVK